MRDLVLTLLSAASACTAVLVMIAMLRVYRTGPGRVADLRRRGYGLSRWWTGQLAKTRFGSTFDELEGLNAMTREGRVSRVTQTRAPASHL